MKANGRDFFESQPEENDRVSYCVRLFYQMMRERDYLPGQVAVEKPFKESEIEYFIMKNPSLYDIMDVMRIVKACDSEYISIRAQENKKGDK